MDLTQNDIDELRMEAEKSLALGSPHTRRTITLDADKLLWLLGRAEEMSKFDSELDSRPTREEVDEALRDAEVPSAYRFAVMDLLF